MRIDQFHSGTAAGDAITNQMLLIQSQLLEEGYESTIYAEHIAPTLSDKIVPFSKYKEDENSILIIHHSMGHDFFEDLISKRARKILIYHNITPEKFFTDEGIRAYIRKGLKQTKEYSKHVEYAIADSNYNRKELYRMGFKNVDVMPVNISIDRFDSINRDEELYNKYKYAINILFVGRVVPNKCQEDLIQTLKIFSKYYDTNCNLLLAGDLSFDNYVTRLKTIAKKNNIEDKVIFLGKVSESELKSCYEVANVFLCMSEHEGFGVPILEAMKMKVPVIAFDSSAISETMSKAGILSYTKRPEVIATLINTINNDTELKNRIIEHQIKRIENSRQLDTKILLLKTIGRILDGDRKRTIQLQGPFESSYSLAIVNRKLMEAMDNEGRDDISIYCTEGPGDYEPKESDLKDKEQAKRLWQKSKDVKYPDVTIRNMYPPRVYDVNGALNFFAFGWEEDRIPKEYIEDFNKYLIGIGTMSDFVTSSLIKSGIKIAVKTMGIGVQLCENFENIKPYKKKHNKKTNFLHISSAFPRKGVDILLEGYFEEFTGDDDVCLILKTFPNIHNKTVEIIEELRKKYKNPPLIDHINYDMNEEDLNSLYKAADCYVQMSRGEGFGLPVAEAMLARVPVIASNNTGMADFTNDNTAMVVDYTMELAKSHLSEDESKWAKPNKETMKMWMRKFVDSKDQIDLQRITENAYKLISTKFSWEAVAQRWKEFIDENESTRIVPDVDMITTWNTKCGIAEYTEMLVDEMINKVNFTIYPNLGDKILKHDQQFVKDRLWQNAFTGDMQALTEEIRRDSSEYVHIQFNFGFYDLNNLSRFIDEICDLKKIVITFHKVADSKVGDRIVSLQSISPSLNKCTALIIHQKSDEKLLIEFGIDKERIHLVPLGQLEYPDCDIMAVRKKLKINSSLVLSSYGFLLKHKGIKDVICSLPLIKQQYPDVLYIVSCALHESVESREYLEECKRTVDKLSLQDNVRFYTDFLPKEVSIELLQASDICIMPYRPSQESASGAIRFCIAAHRPVIVTNQYIFNEFTDEVIKIDSGDEKVIAKAVMELFTNKGEMQRLVEAENKYIAEHSWKNASNKTYEIYQL